MQAMRTTKSPKKTNSSSRTTKQNERINVHWNTGLSWRAYSDKDTDGPNSGYIEGEMLVHQDKLPLLLSYETKTCLMISTVLVPMITR